MKLNHRTWKKAALHARMYAALFFFWMIAVPCAETASWRGVYAAAARMTDGSGQGRMDRIQMENGNELHRKCGNCGIQGFDSITKVR